METPRAGGASPNPRADVVVVAWNGCGLLPACLKSLRAQTRRPREVIVVDNASTDGTAELIRAEYPEVALIANPRNTGFAGGANAGIRRALERGAEFVAVLNQDVELDPRWLETLLETATADPSIAAVGSRILLASHPTLINSTGIEINLSGRVCDRGFGRADAARWRERREVLGVSGGAMLLSAGALAKVALFDEGYFAYYEDADLSVRLWEAGYRLVYEPRAIVHHGYSASFGVESPLKIRLLEGNRFRFLFRHYPLGRLARIAPQLLLEEARYLAHRARRDGWRGVRLCAGIYGRALAGLPAAVRWRRRHGESGRRSRWWRFVTPERGYFDIVLPQLDYAVARSAERAVTDRVIVGVSDEVLGEGWYPRVDPSARSRRAEAGPAFRAFGSTAVCALRVREPGAHVLQLHVRSRWRDRVVAIEHGGVDIGSVDIPRGNWRTVQMPLDVESEAIAIRLRIDTPTPREESGEKWDIGLEANEVSLLHPDSPHLRRASPASASPFEKGGSRGICLDASVPNVPLTPLVPGTHKRPHILYVVHRFWPYPGGSERYFFELARRSAQRGFAVSVLTTDAWDYEHLYLPGKKRIEKVRELVDGVDTRRRRVRHWPGRNRFWTLLSRFSTRAAPRAIQPWVPGFRRALERSGPFDLVHAGVFPFTGLIAEAEKLCRRRGVPFVCQPMLNLRDLRTAEPDPFYLSSQARALLSRATAIVANTRLESAALGRFGARPDAITVASPAVSPNDLEGGDGERFRVRHGLAAKSRLLLQISTQTYDKGSLHSIAALRALSDAGRDVRLALVGPVLSDAARELARLPAAIRERVLVLGQIAEQDKKDALAACDALVMPSRTDSFGIAYLEAWCYRKPVIGCFAGGVPEVIDDGADGFLVPFGDDHMLAEYAAKLLDEPALATSMGEHGRAKVERLYTWDRTYPVVEALYRRLLARGS